jgi:hypothetical protein
LWLLHLVLLLLQGKKQKPSKGGSVPLPSFKRWRNDEISRFQTQLVQLGAGRLEDVKREVSRWCVCCMGIQHSLSHKSQSLLSKIVAAWRVFLAHVLPITPMSSARHLSPVAVASVFV